MQYARTFGFTVWLQPLDAYLSRGGVAHSGAVSGRLGLPGVPVTAETVALHTILELVRATGCTRPPVPAVVGGRSRAGSRGAAARGCR